MTEEEKEEVSKKLSEACSGENNGMHGKSHDKESKRKMGQSSCNLNEECAKAVLYFRRNDLKTRKELADKYNTTESTIEKVENRTYWPNLEVNK